MGLRVFSFGGGKQSVAALVLAAQGKIDYRIFVFSNVGNDSENPDTITYFKKYARPFASKHGILLQEIRRHPRSGEDETLLQWLTKPGSRTIGIPVRMANGAPGNRLCTETYKIRVVSNYVKESGASASDPWTLGMGISLDEFQRMRNSSGYKHYNLDYPLINLNLTRTDCIKIITDAGLPEPPKSSCWFCPYHRVAEWEEIRATKPKLFQQAVDLEKFLNHKRAEFGKDNVYLSSRRMPLEEAVKVTAQDTDDATCDSGFCFM